MKTMNLLNKILFSALILGVSFIACSDDDDDDNPTPATNTGGGSGGGTGGGTMADLTVNGMDFFEIGTDVTGDANSGLDATNIYYSYDSTSDSLHFLVKVVNMSNFSSSPSIDFNFILPNGTDGNKPLANPFRGSQSHKTASVYTDNGGTAPSTYTYTNVAGFAVNGIAYTDDVSKSTSGSDLSGICSGCVTLMVDVTNNWIICGMDRSQVISDTEVGATKSAKIKMSSNVGYQRGNNDLTTDGAEFTITIP